MMCTTRLAWLDTSCSYTIIFLQFSDLNAHESFHCVCVILKNSSVHVHNNRINFMKTDGILEMEGQVLVMVCLQVAVPLSH